MLDMNRSYEIKKLMQDNGFFIARSNKHTVWKHPTAATIITSATPSCRYTLQKIRRKLKKIIE